LPGREIGSMGEKQNKREKRINFSLWEAKKKLFFNLGWQKIFLNGIRWVVKVPSIL
jgi:hypothetical protein